MTDIPKDIMRKAWDLSGEGCACGDPDEPGFNCPHFRGNICRRQADGIASVLMEAESRREALAIAYAEALNEIGRLREALKPFADWQPFLIGNGNPVVGVDPDECDAREYTCNFTPRLGDIRRARAALNSKSHDREIGGGNG